MTINYEGITPQFLMAFQSPARSFLLPIVIGNKDFTCAAWTLPWLKPLWPEEDRDESESARDVYSKRRIIAVTKLEIVDWHNSSILVGSLFRRDDDTMSNSRKGRFQQCLHSRIEDMLVLLFRQVDNLTFDDA
ncbi:hypothetical protein Tco_0551067 [Tanacetum coccineum]